MRRDCYVIILINVLLMSKKQSLILDLGAGVLEIKPVRGPSTTVAGGWKTRTFATEFSPISVESKNCEKLTILLAENKPVFCGHGNWPLCFTDFGEFLDYVRDC
jgi:hypothetical protein